jgi:hypothetical protein
MLYAPGSILFLGPWPVPGDGVSRYFRVRALPENQRLDTSNSCSAPAQGDLCGFFERGRFFFAPALAGLVLLLLDCSLKP